LPPVAAAGGSLCDSALHLGTVFVLVSVLVVVPIRRRPAVKWLSHETFFAAGRGLRWAVFEKPE